MLDRLLALPGEIGFYYENLVTGGVIEYGADRPLVAASVIKLPLMIEAFHQFEQEGLDPQRETLPREADLMPSCGVLTYLRDMPPFSVRDLVTLSIIVSDNTATNLLIDMLSIDSVNAMLSAEGAEHSRLRRRLFDAERSAQGIENTVTAREMGMLLKKLYQGTLISKKASGEMLEILSHQQLGGKIPFYFTDGTKIAHKTGEDSGTTHDVGIVFAKEPFVFCFLSNHTDVPAAECAIQFLAWEAANAAK